MPSRWVLRFGAIVLALGLLSAEPAHAMSAYLWSKRPVLVFAPSPGHPSLVEQQRIFAAARVGLAERDIVVIWVIGDKVQAEMGPAPKRSAAALRASYGAPEAGFKTALVGKDGGVKLAQGKPFSVAALFATIDAMPMRRDEMRRR